MRRDCYLGYGICQICGKEFLLKELVSDHHHESGQQRGRLCFHCNVLLGHAREDEDILQAAIEYLEKWRMERVREKIRTYRGPKTGICEALSELGANS